MRALLRTSPGSLPRTGDVPLDPAVLLGSLAVSIVAGVLFGLAPAWKLSGARFGLLLKEGARRQSINGAGARARRALIVVEMALAVALVVGSALMLRTVRTLLAVDTGFEASNLTTFELFLPPTTYPEASDQMGFYSRLDERLKSTPGVEQVGSANGLPPQRELDANDMEFEGIEADPNGPPHNVDYWQFASGDYLETMKIAVLSGRGFESTDARGSTPGRAGQPDDGGNVLAWHRCGRAPPAPGRRSALDHDRRRGRGRQAGRHRGGHRHRGLLQLRAGGRAVRRVPAAHHAHAGAVEAPAARDRAHDPRRGDARSIRRCRSRGLSTMEDVVRGSIARPRFIALLLAIFAGAALFLAAIGIYGVLSYSVAQRAQELGIRMALGADRRRILRLVMSQGLLLALAGVVSASRSRSRSRA